MRGTSTTTLLPLDWSGNWRPSTEVQQLRNDLDAWERWAEQILGHTFLVNLAGRDAVHERMRNAISGKLRK
jgi:hypothetical protein